MKQHFEGTLQVFVTSFSTKQLGDFCLFRKYNQRYKRTEMTDKLGNVKMAGMCFIRALLAEAALTMSVFRLQEQT